MSRMEQNVTWYLSPNGCVPWIALVGNERWEVRVNDFPQEPNLYTLLVDGKSVQDFKKWPACWTRPPLESMAKVHLFVLREFEQERFENQLRSAKSAAPPPDKGTQPMSVDELFDAVDAENARNFADAEREAAASGKEPFDLDRLREIRQFPPGTPMPHEETLRTKYYVWHPEVRNLTEFAKTLDEVEAWDD